MELMQAIRERRSHRSFASQIVEEEKLGVVLEAGRWAPSVMNAQPWRFLVLKNPQLKEQLKNECLATRQMIFEKSGWKWVSNFSLEFISEAPVIIVVTADPKKTGADQFILERGVGYAYSCCAAIQNMHLAAHSQGLGSLWFTMFEGDRVKRLLGIAPELDVVGMVLLGYPGQELPPLKRKALEELVTVIE